MKTKICTKCELPKRLDEFFPLYGKSNHNSWCKQCHTTNNIARMKFRRDNEPGYREYVRNYARKRRFRIKFGITIEDYEKMLAAQGGGCAICHRTDKVIDGHLGTPKMFPVDHDHKTGRMRGILCDRCNRGIGLLQDSVELIKSALKYLQKHS